MAERESPDLVFLDIKMPGLDGLEVLSRLRGTNETLPVVIVSAHGIGRRRRSKPAGSARSASSRSRCRRTTCSTPCAKGVELGSLRRENRTLRSALETRHQLIGESAPLKQIMEQVRRAAPTNATVLILGESGVGKELIARAIHRGQPARERALRAGQLRGDSRGADRVRALRPRARRVHRRHREADRQVRAWPTAGRSSSTKSAT